MPSKPASFIQLKIRRLVMARTIFCVPCDGYGRVNHRCGMVCVDDECSACGGLGYVPNPEAV